MSPNAIVKDSLVIGGLSFLGYIAGGKLGSMLGAVIGTVVCSLFNSEEPIDHHRSDGPHRYTPYPQVTNTTKCRRKINKSTDESNEPTACSICLEQFKPSILLLPCSHMCFCDDCFEKVRKQKVSSCPICRQQIEEFVFANSS